jgi:hypothetical protein
MLSYLDEEKFEYFDLRQRIFRKKLNRFYWAEFYFKLLQCIFKASFYSRYLNIISEK